MSVSNDKRVANLEIEAVDQVVVEAAGSPHTYIAPEPSDAVKALPFKMLRKATVHVPNTGESRTKADGRASFFPTKEPVSNFLHTLVENTLFSLDHDLGQLNEGNYSSAVIENIFKSVETARSLAQNYWKSDVLPHLKQHPIHDFLNEEPCVNWSRAKHRGYSGDAVLMDMLYRYRIDFSKLTKKQKLMYTEVTSRPSSVAVRERVKFIATHVQDSVAQVKFPKVVSIACGHMRELDHLSAAEFKGTYVCVDQDPLSLATVRQDYSDFALQQLECSVVDIIKGRHYETLVNADFIYSSGLYDYLNDNLAQKLTSFLFSLLNHGGKLLLTNFTPTCPDIGFMETFMDWHLIYRNIREIELFFNDIPTEQIKSKQVFFGENKNIVYTLIQKI